MKTRNFIVRSGALLLLSTLIYQLSTCPARAQGTAFLYQGREVNLAGQPINNLGANLKFNLYHRQGIPPDSYSDSLFGTITTNSVSIVNGLFSLELDFGAAAFDGSDCWLEVQDVTGAPSSIITFPKQHVVAVPYATMAGNVAANAVTRASIASGQVVKSLDGLFDDVSLLVGDNLTLTTNGNTLTIAANPVTGASIPSGRPLMVMSDLEIDRARAQAPHCRVASLGQYQQKLRAQGIMRPGLAHVVRQILREKGIRRVTVPDNFPLGLPTGLEKLGIPVKPRPGNFFPERETKSAAEVRKISAALVMAEVGMAEAMQVLRTAKIGRDRKLLYHNLPLTSEKLRAVIDCAILQACGLAANTIVAGGRQACDPHERGYGPLRAHEPIIIDIFPRSQKTG